MKWLPYFNRYIWNTERYTVYLSVVKAQGFVILQCVGAGRIQANGF
jgi:hypothetical protein